MAMAAALSAKSIPNTKTPLANPLSPLLSLRQPVELSLRSPDSSLRRSRWIYTTKVATDFELREVVPDIKTGEELYSFASFFLLLRFISVFVLVELGSMLMF